MMPSQHEKTKDVLFLLAFNSKRMSLSCAVSEI